MTIPTTGTNESSPAGSDNIALGDNRIREHKTQVREIMEVDHEYPSSGQSATAGQHKQVTLQEAADIGTGATGVPILGAQTVSGAPELVYTNEADTDIQITNTTGIDAPSITGVYAAANVAALATMMALIYPIGIIITLGVSTNPNTLLGIGTWSAIAGKVVVGLDTGGGTFDTLNNSGGAETVTLTGGQSGTSAHTHSIPTVVAAGGGGLGKVADGQSSNSTAAATSASSEANADDAHTNLQPYIVKYIWQRTA